MIIMKKLAVLLIFVKILLVTVVLGESDSFACPQQCDCHFLQVHWVTDCSDSNLTSMPHDELSKDTYVINMNENNLTTLGQFRPGLRVRRLQAAHNQLTSLDQANFRGLRNLLDVDFSWNHIIFVDPAAFKDSPGLITLELQHNPLTNVDGTFIVSQSLRFLDLGHCNFNRISKNFFQNITSLNKLNFSGNPLASLHDGIFEPIASLEILGLSRCRLSHISKNALQNLVNLKTLELSNNHLANTDWRFVFGGLTRVELLDLKNSGISHLPEDVFSNNTWLKNLILAENELNNLDMVTTFGGNLKHLNILDISNCNLRGPFSEEVFSFATKLSTLVLSGNAFSETDLKTVLRPLVYLQKLSLKHCSITRLPGDILHHLEHLQKLDISRNNLVDPFAELRSPLYALEYLDMSYCNLKHLFQDTFSKMTNLKKLVLSGNPLKLMESGVLQNLNFLETLELSYCRLTHPPDAAVFVQGRTYTNLQELNLRGNPLRVDEKPLLPEKLSRLEKIDLSHCNIRALPRNSFENTPNITSLVLSENRLGARDDENALDFLKHLPNLALLDISENFLRNLKPDVFEENPSLSSVDLTGNQWACGCYLAEIWEWATNSIDDIQVLVGLNTQSQEVAAGGVKRRRGLTCSDTTSTTNAQNAHISWAKYVKKSGCKVVTAFSNESFEKLLNLPDFRSSIDHYKNFHLNESPPPWLVAIAALAVFLLMATIFTAVLVLLMRRAKQHRRVEQARLRKEEDARFDDNTMRVELTKYLQQRRQFDNEGDAYS